jgi:hypothetical protein
MSKGVRYADLTNKFSAAHAARSGYTSKLVSRRADRMRCHLQSPDSLLEISLFLNLGS